MSFLDKASYYIEMGWPIFPQSVTKAPCIKGGCHAATLDRGIISEWDSIYPGANVAVATGKKPSSLIVVDLDGPEAEEDWEKIVKKHLFTEPRCPIALTSRGRHLYFTGTSGVKNSCGALGRHIDVKSEGGAVTVPPSRHVSGFIYGWAIHPHDVPPGPFPPVLFRLLNGKEEARRRKYYVTPMDRPPPDLSRLAEMVARSSPGERNHTLNRAAFLASKAVQAGTVSHSQALGVLTNAALQAGLLRHEIQPTILSGLRGGAKKL